MATATATAPLAQLQDLGQSVWVDFMSRQFVRNGELRRLIEVDGIRGVTSNPTIFEKAIGHSADYDDEIRRMAAGGADVDAIYRSLTVADIREALDLFRPVYDATDARDGYVSLEVSPRLAHDTGATVAEAKALWQELDRPNAMIKIPATREGIPAIEECLTAGLNVNVTLLFSVEAYGQVARAYLRALRRRADRGDDVARVASVASFFVSRIDAEADARMAAQMKKAVNSDRKFALGRLQGKLAIANAKNAYALFRSLFGGVDFAVLRAKGARPQRLLWASVGTKNPQYRDTIYVDELIGPETVSTMPPATYEAVKDHGRVRRSLAEATDDAQRLVERLPEVGIDYKELTDKLLRDGVASFADSFDQLMASIAAKRESMLARSA